MSDSEVSKNGHSDDEVNDLFGDEPDVEANGAQPAGDEVKQEDGEDDKDDDGEDGDEDDEEQNLKTLEYTLPRHAVAHKPDQDTYLLKLPVFLNVDAHPFDPSEFKEKIEQSALDRSKRNMNAKDAKNDLIAEKLLNENTIRWRYSNSGNDEIIKQSNAHFVQWSDGLMSLKICQELFDFRELSVSDQYLARSHVEHELLQNDSAFTKSASLLPTLTATDTHRKLTQAVKNIQKKDKILSALTHHDPMLKQRQADEDERKTLKMKRQLEQRRRLQEERLGKSDTPSMGRGDDYARTERFAYDEYDEDDGFVANDDEENEEVSDSELEAEEEEFEKGAERLKSLRQDGDAKYRASAGDDVEDRRKRRRIIDSDEDE